MLLPYSASSSRRSAFWALLWVSVLGPAVLGVVCFLSSSRVAPWFGLLSLLSGVAAITVLCVWCAVYVRDEPRLIRIALIWIALLFLLVTVGIGVALIASPSIGGDTKEWKVRADIQAIRTMLLSYGEQNGHFPKTDQGLEALVPRFMEELPKDAWGTPYVYRYPGKRYPNAYDLFSTGPDRIADTADDEWGK
jgi:general secretion pathway protein G